MKHQHQTKTADGFRGSLRVVKGFQQEATGLSLLVNTAWHFAYTALWNNCVFSAKEINTSKQSIKEILQAAASPADAYHIFCQRVLLARQYVNSQPNRYIPLPSVWLYKENATGFAGTREWYNNIRDTRAALPQYKIELKAFSEAVLEMSEDPSIPNFQYWSNYFKEKKMPGLLSLFLCTVANLQYSL